MSTLPPHGGHPERRVSPRPPRRAARFVVRPPRPTPIWISRRGKALLAAGGVVLLLLLLIQAPTVLVVTLGGIALALVMSFPVRLLARVLPWGWAILVSFLLVLGLVALGLAVLVPILVEQLGALVNAAPEWMRRAEDGVRGFLEPLTRRGFVPGSPEQLMARLGREIVGLVQNIVEGLLGRAGRLVAGTFNTLIMLFGVVFIAVYLLVDERKIQAAYLRAAPKRYRQDARELWNAFGYSLSRFLSGLGLSLAIQGVLSAVALMLLGVPYALLLGFWVAVTGLIPYVGAFAGAIPAIIVAFTVSPTTALFTALVFFGIQQLEGNILTPRIQGDAIRVHPIVVFLAIIAGGELAGILGVLFALPALAVLRVVFDFLRARLRTVDRRHAVAAPVPARHVGQAWPGGGAPPMASLPPPPAVPPAVAPSARAESRPE